MLWDLELFLYLCKQYKAYKNECLVKIFSTQPPIQLWAAILKDQII